MEPVTDNPVVGRDSSALRLRALAGTSDEDDLQPNV